MYPAISKDCLDVTTLNMEDYNDEHTPIDGLGHHGAGDISLLTGMGSGCGNGEPEYGHCHTENGWLASDGNVYAAFYYGGPATISGGDGRGEGF